MKNKRLLDIGAMTTKVAIKELESLTLKLFMSKEKKQQQDLATQQEIAEIIFAKMSQLKGTGLKLLQALSLDEDLLPLPYIKKFEAAYGQVTPLSRPVVNKVFKLETGQTPETVFKAFNYQPIAAASLGQVHQATLESGEEVMVKVQYPNVAENMERDLGFISSFSNVIGNSLIKGAVEELSQSLLAETDYRLEAGNIELFRRLPRPNRVTLPRVFKSHSSQRILTLSKIEGQTLNLASSQRQKDQALQDVFNFFSMSLTRGQCLHADPHPGNFLVSEGKTGIVDFGSVKKNIPENVIALFLSLLDQDSRPHDLVDLYLELGATAPDGHAPFFEKHIKDYHELCLELMNQKSLQFSGKGSLISKMRRILFSQSGQPNLKGLSPEFSLLHKAFQSLLFLMCKYNATVDTHIPKI